MSSLTWPSRLLQAVAAGAEDEAGREAGVEAAEEEEALVAEAAAVVALVEEEAEEAEVAALEEEVEAEVRRIGTS